MPGARRWLDLDMQTTAPAMPSSTAVFDLATLLFSEQPQPSLPFKRQNNLLGHIALRFLFLPTVAEVLKRLLQRDQLSSAQVNARALGWAYQCLGYREFSCKDALQCLWEINAYDQNVRLSAC